MTVVVAKYPAKGWAGELCLIPNSNFSNVVVIVAPKVIVDMNDQVAFAQQVTKNPDYAWGNDIRRNKARLIDEVGTRSFNAPVKNGKVPIKVRQLVSGI